MTLSIIFQVTYSDGVTILPNAPAAGEITSAILATDKKTMTVQWKKVASEGGAKLQYSWSFFTDGVTQLTPWTLVTGATSEGGKAKVKLLSIISLIDGNYVM